VTPQCKCRDIKQVRKHLYFSPDAIPVIQMMENKLTGARGLYWEEEKRIQAVRGTTLKK